MSGPLKCETRPLGAVGPLSASCVAADDSENSKPAPATQANVWALLTSIAEPIAVALLLGGCQ
jgi:hypothetical protein